MRGGEASPPRAPAHDTDLPGVQLRPSQFDEVRALSGIFAKMRPEAGSRLSDRGSHGECGFLCLAFALMTQGKLQFIDAAAYASPTLRDHHLARSLRARVCAHGRHLTTQTAMVAQDGAGGGESITIAAAMVSSLASWISRDDAARFGGGALTVGTYLSLMSRSADPDAEPPTLGTYLDSGSLALAADLYLIRIIVRLYGSSGEEVPSSPQTFLPREGVSPTTEVRLRCKADEHFVLEAFEAPSQPPPSTAPAALAAPLPLDQSSYDKVAAEVARRGDVFRAEQEALSRAALLAQALEAAPPDAELPMAPPASPRETPGTPSAAVEPSACHGVRVSAEAAAEVARRGRSFGAQQLNLRQACLRSADAVDADRVLSELGDIQNGGIAVLGAHGDGTDASASAAGRPTSGIDKRSRATAFSDADQQVALALHLEEESGRAARQRTDDPSPPGGCAICGGVDAFGGTMLCASCGQALCPACFPPTQHEPCCSAPRSPLPDLELVEHTCDRCSRVWLCSPPTEAHADCEFCSDDAAPPGLVLLGSRGAPPMEAPPAAPDHWSESHAAAYLRRLTVTEAAALFHRSRAMSARCLADLASVSMADQATASHHQSQGGYYRQYIFEGLAREAEVPYTSVCSMLFGCSRQHAQAVIVLGVGAYGVVGPVQAFSELREDTDPDAATTAMRGLAEELLGLEGPLDVHQATQALLARAHEATYPLVHLGRDPAASHRAFAVHADVFFADGIDGAVARFQPNAEICALVVVPLEGVTGEAGEVEVVDVLGHRRRLRGNRHLGAPRVRWARAMLAGIAADAPSAPPPPPAPPPAPEPPAPPRQAREVRFAEPPAAPRGGSVAPGGDDPGAGRAADAAPGPQGGAQEELSSFTFPLRSLDEVRRLRLCRSAAPTDLVGFEFTGAVRVALESTGRRALSVDWRACEAGGMHAVLDVRDVIELGGWERVFLFPPCFQQLRADRDCLQAKIADCRAFWGCALVLWCFCVAADLLVVEQPDTIVSDFVLLSFMEFRTSCFRDEPDKYVRLFLRNAVLPLPFAADPTARKPVRPYLEYASSDARDRDKSSWLPFANMCRALARMVPNEEPPPAPADYLELIESFAAAWHAAGHPVPAGYSDSRAMPPPGARRYQSFRGPGDGRVPPAVVPLLAAPLARGGAVADVGPRRTGLLGGARGDRNQDLLLVGSRVRCMGRAGVGLYDVTDIDAVQRHAYIVTNVLTNRAGCRVDLVPGKRKGADEALAALGEWQLLPGSRDIVPYSPESYVCNECFAQSTFRPCIICSGGAVGPGHALVTESGTTVASLDAETVAAAVPLAVDSTPRALAAPQRAPLATVDVRAATEATVLLVFVSVLLRPLVFAHVNGFTMHGVVLPSLDSRTSCVHAAQGLVSAAVGATAASAFLVGEYLGGARLTVAPLDFRPARHLMCRTRAARLARLASGCTFLWCSLAALSGTPSGDAAARAILACEAYVKPGHMLADFSTDASAAPLAFRIGAMAATSVLSRPLLDHVTSPPAWRAIAESGRQNQRLIDALAVASADHLLAGWADRVGPIDPSDIPASLLAALPSFGEHGLETHAYTPVYRPFATDWLPLPPAQPEAPTGAPACIRSPADMMLPETQLAVAAWLRHALQDLQRIRLAVDEGRATQLSDGTERRDRPRALAVGQLELHPWARGRVWDCRGPCCKLLDFRAPINTHLDTSYLRRRLADYPDQYFVANLLEGARLDADVELQSVLVPHLVSLPKGYTAVGKELRRMRGLGWYDFFPDFPFWPMYLNAQGSTARKLELDRDRRTTEGGGPRMPTFDLGGLAAISINAASFMYHMPQHFVSDTRPEMLAWLRARGLPPPSAAAELLRTVSKWHKELKPDLAKLMRDLAILKRAGRVLGLAVYGFGDDAKDYFNQLAMAECELHKLGIVFLAEPGDLTTMSPVGSPFGGDPEAGPDKLVFISELRLGFGTHGASNLAQRFSEALLHLFRLDMDVAEAAFFDAPDPAMNHWLGARRKVAERLALNECQAEGACPHGPAIPAIELHYRQQRRLYTAYMYTDDPIWVVVGVDRTLRALRVWRQLTDAVGLIMAIPEKRHLGAQILWLGVLIIISLGIVVVPKAKLLRASSAVTAVLAGGQPFHLYRSLMGLLEHLRAVNLQGRNVMHGLYVPHSPLGASRFGPEGRVYCDELMRKQLQRWCHLLRQSAGVSVRRAFARDEVEPPPSSLTVFACSDACFGDADPNGIGGFCHGLYWRFAVPACDEDVLSTPLLEFLGVVFNIIALADSVPPLLGDRGTLLLRTDALTTALVLPRESQKSPLLVDAFHFLAQTEEWRLLSPRLRIQHIFGDSMAMSDPISRDRLAEFFARCRQLGIKPACVALPPLCRRVYDQVIVLERARRLHAQRTAPVVSGGADDAAGWRDLAQAPPVPAPPTLRPIVQWTVAKEPWPARSLHRFDRGRRTGLPTAPYGRFCVGCLTACTQASWRVWPGCRRCDVPLCAACLASHRCGVARELGDAGRRQTEIMLAVSTAAKLSDGAYQSKAAAAAADERARTVDEEEWDVSPLPGKRKRVQHTYHESGLKQVRKGATYQASLEWLSAYAPEPPDAREREVRAGVAAALLTFRRFDGGSGATNLVNLDQPLGWALPPLGRCNDPTFGDLMRGVASVWFDGRRLNLERTVRELGVEHGDQLDLCPAQTGGGPRHEIRCIICSHVSCYGCEETARFIEEREIHKPNFCCQCGWRLALEDIHSRSGEVLRARCVERMAAADRRGLYLRGRGFYPADEFDDPTLTITLHLVRVGGRGLTGRSVGGPLLVSREATLGLSLTAYLDGASVVLRDGSRLSLESTPRELGLEEGDELDLCMPQTGGGFMEALLAKRCPPAAPRSPPAPAPDGPPKRYNPPRMAPRARHAAPPTPPTFMGQLGAAKGVALASPTEPTRKAPRLAAGLPLPTLTLPERSRARLESSRLAAAAKTYANARALALTGGPDPNMALRADVASLCFAGDTLSDYSEFGTNSNTLKKDDRAWDFWETVCERAGTSPMRTPQEVRENPERQAWLLAILMLYASAVCVSKTPGRAGVHQTALGAGVPLGHHPHL